jgi:dolichol-phosphate mannosyltransferase
MKISVIIPTYNEEENIEILVPLLLEKFKSFKNYNFNILFVDGNSRDKTVAVIKKFQKEYQNIYLIEEESKSGLGGAYIKGYIYSIEKIKADYVVEMDADLQHNPEDFPKLIQKISEGYDFIVGSRYVRGGSIPKEWALYRKLISYFGSFFARTLLRISKVKDFTSGFRVTKVKGILDQIEFSKLKSKGFAYKLDMLVRIYDLKAKICEVPISFGLRDRGTSKMEKKNFMDSLYVVLEFAKERNKAFLKFLIVGFGGLFTDLTVFSISDFYTTSSNSSLISGFTAMILTFILNNFWSFKERQKISLKILLPTFIVYSISSYIPILLRSYLIHFMEVSYGDNIFIKYPTFFVGVLFGIVWNFTVYSKIIWRKK